MDPANPYDDVGSWADHGLAGLKILIVVLLMAALWFLIDRITHFDDEREIFVEGNVPYGVLRSTLVLAQAIATLPLLAMKTGDVWSDLRPLLGWGVGVLLVLALLSVLLDRIVGGGQDLSLPRALVKSGFLIGTALVFNGALTGEAPDLGTAIGATVVFALVGMVYLLIAFWVLSISGVFRPERRRAPSTLSTAIVSAGLLISLGLVLRTSIAGDFDGWGSGLADLSLTFVAGFVALFVLILVIDLSIIRSHTLRQIVQDDNWLAAVVMAAMLISVGLLIDAVAV